MDSVRVARRREHGRARRLGRLVPARRDRPDRASCSDLALERGINLHVDGCLGGFVLAWGEELGYPVPRFDFRLPGVTSISADTHKYGFALKGSSVLLYRTPELRKLQYFIVPDWPGGLYTSPGMSGSRSGGIIATAWAAMASLGREGYRRIAGDIFRTAAELKQIIGAHSELRVLGDPFFNVAFSHVAGGPGVDIFHVNDCARREGLAAERTAAPAGRALLRHPPEHAAGRDGPVRRRPRRRGRVREGARRATTPRSGATYGGGGVDVPREAVAAGMVGWLDATQALPPTLMVGTGLRISIGVRSCDSARRRSAKRSGPVRASGPALGRL